MDEWIWIMVAGSGDVSFWQAARYVAELRKKYSYWRGSHTISS
jgi:hypothetical protein